MDDTDTIAALATAVGGPVAVVRVSGPAAETVVGRCWQGRVPLAAQAARTLCLGRVVAADGRPLDQALAVRFPAPGSYTGEPMVEVHGHGGGLVARTVLARILECGARGAEPGEFTKRAFLNGRMDLTRAEAVADLIAAHSEMALRLANRQLHGALSRQVDGAYDQACHWLGELEARLDFPEEDVPGLPVAEVTAGIRELQTTVGRLLRGRAEGEVLRHGVRVVIAGPPNVGKSSLLNAMLGWDRAIVSHLPGTTRDTLEELAHIRGIPVRLVDTAGIRQATDEVEKCGIARSYTHLRVAQVVLWVVEAARSYHAQALPAAGGPAGAVIVVANKRDLAAGPPTDVPPELGPPVCTCALDGTGLEDLFDAVEQRVWGRPHADEPDVAVSLRHAALLDSALEHLRAAERTADEQQWELAAESLRGALGDLGRVSGRTVTPDILESIFARFCIGK